MDASDHLGIDGPFFDIAYTYDGSLEGLLSAVFDAYAHHEEPSDISLAANLQPRLGQYIRHIETNFDHAQRVHRGVVRAGGQAAFDAIKNASLSDDPSAGTVVYRFIRHAMSRCRSSVMSDIAHPDVEPLVRMAKAVANERHYMMQFVRFEQLENGVWFSRCNPKASVVPLLMDWFTARFNTQPFILYDETHHLAGVYEGREWHLVNTEGIDLPSRLPKRTGNEQLMQQAWRRFYRAIAIESRYNPELRRQFMPKRFWRNLTELQEDLPGLSVR